MLNFNAIGFSGGDLSRFKKNGSGSSFPQNVQANAGYAGASGGGVQEASLGDAMRRFFEMPQRSSDSTPSLVDSPPGKSPVKLQVIEPDVKDEHAVIVSNVAEEHLLGNTEVELSRLEELSLFQRIRDLFTPKDIRNIEDFGKWVDELSSSVLNQATGKIRDTIKEHGDGERQVLNLSLAMNRAKIYDSTLKFLDENEGFRKALVGEDLAGKTNSDAYRQAVVDFIDNRIDQNPDHQKALQDYQAISAEAAEKGIAIVVAAGNEQKIIDRLGLSHSQGGIHPDALKKGGRLHAMFLLSFLSEGRNDHDNKKP